MATHHGECFCGAVQVEVTGEPEGMGYCHCSSCRSWSGGPVNAFTLWKPDAVKITALLAATMNQKSSLREDPQFVSLVLTGDSFSEAIKPPLFN
jgi:hypothetical protein